MKALFLAAALLATGLQAPDEYEWPTDGAVLEKIDNWRDLKFGVILHWGLYSVPGIVESWNLCNEDWIVRPEGSTYEGYKQWYWGLSKDLNPVKFNPSQWADVFDRAGMKYIVFTTKHHDGFCMFDSAYTDFSIAKGPFGQDVVKPVFDTFRSRGYMIGAYFSKPDWHHPGFWNPYYATPNRHPNYRKDMHPDWWSSYVTYTKNQLQEITGGRYGNIDILWLDGGWITGDEVGLGELLPGMREKNPGMICVDRTIGGPNENYQTPEHTFPETQQDWPWETCIPLSSDWGWTPGHKYKTARRVIGMLSEIVAKGGNMLLGIGPTPEGLIDDEAAAILADVGTWLGRCGEAIYGTHCIPVYHDGNIWFTASKDGKYVYAIYALPDGEELPAELSWEGNVPKGSVKVLNNGRSASARIDGCRVTVKLPKGLPQEPVVLRFKLR